MEKGCLAFVANELMGFATGRGRNCCVEPGGRRGNEAVSVTNKLIRVALVTNGLIRVARHGV